MSMFILGLLLAGPAHAGRNEVSFVVAPTFSTTDTPLSGSSRVHAGVRAGGQVWTDHRGLGLSVVGGWHTGRQTFDANYGGDEQEYVEVDGGFTTHALQAGLKFDYEVKSSFFPYLRAEAGVGFGTASAMNGALGSQFRSTGVAATGTFTGGFDWMLPDRTLGWRVVPGLFVEAGYEAATPMKLGVMGTTNTSGVVLRTGIGLRF